MASAKSEVAIANPSPLNPEAIAGYQVLVPDMAVGIYVLVLFCHWVCELRTLEVMLVLVNVPNPLLNSSLIRYTSSTSPVADSSTPTFSPQETGAAGK